MAITFRPAQPADIPSLALIRAAEWESEAYWTRRIADYLAIAGPSRTIVVAEDDGATAGFVAGHLTRRFGCDGELQWLNVRPQSRRLGLGARLVTEIGLWFVNQRALRICVDVDPSNTPARRLYSRCGAIPLKPSWLLWENAHLMLSHSPAPAPPDPD